MIARVYGLGLLLAALVLLLTPLHARSTAHLWVIRTLPDHRILLEGSGFVPQVGRAIPVHRHNPSWVYPIGHATVEEVGAAGVIARYDPATLRWPMGRHGTVVAHTGTQLTLDLGTDVGAEIGQTMYGYIDQRQIFEARIVAVDPSASRATLLSVAVDGSLVDTPVTEFTARTRGSPLAAAWLWWVEGVAFALAFAVWIAPGSGARFRALGAVVGRRIATLSQQRGPRIALHLALAPLVPWVFVPFVASTVTTLASAVATAAVGLGASIAVPPPFPEGSLLPLQIVGGAAYLGWVAVRGTSPWLALWRALAYRPPHPRIRGLGLWILHLAIAWAFARTLTGFLAGNLTSIGHLLWPEAGLSFATFRQIAQSVAVMGGTVPTWPGSVGLLHLSRYLLWSVTICGCLLGYGHTLASILWKRTPVLALDFTLAGWITNAMCYGPLLGAVVHHLLPDADFTGPDPAVTEGPLYWGILVVEVGVNALYTASILNLGTLFGVMAYKGLRTTGFYGVVRHPSYTLEPLMFALMYLPGLSGPWAWLSVSSFFVKYWIRAEREDHFLAVAAGEAHAAYRRAVPDKFVPGWR